MTALKRILCAMFIAVIAVGFPLRAEAGNPRVIVESCTVEGGGLVSGAVCEVRVTLRNTSTSAEVSSVLVTGRWPIDNPPPVDFEMTNQAYVNSIGPTQTRNVVFSIKTKPVNIRALDTVPLYLDIVYSSDQSPDNSNTVLLRLPISDEQSGQPESYENDSPAVAGYLAGLPFLDYLQYIYAGGSALCALAAGILMLLRLRRQ